MLLYNKEKNMTKRDKAKVIAVGAITTIGFVVWLVVASTFVVF